MEFKDHFSGHAQDYVRYRPQYPDALYDWLLRQVPGSAVVWECGCGSGQATPQLATRYRRIIATDASAQQIASAIALANVEFRVARAEASGLATNSVDLVCVAQAMHWFDVPRFYTEVLRVCRSGGLLAVWTYGSVSVKGIPSEILIGFEHETLQSHWPAERHHIDDGYAQYQLPGRELDVPSFRMTQNWSLDRLIGYIESWSGLRRYRAATGKDPLPSLRRRIAAQWEDNDEIREISWPLMVRAARL